MSLASYLLLPDWVRFFRIELNRLKKIWLNWASAKERADDIHEMFLDDEVKAVISTIGGDHSNQILKYLDFEIIKNNPKIFMGYSDISNE